jgi:hypothetical protein
MGRTPWQPLPDNGMFSRARFSAQFWWAAAENEQHYVETRCRPAVAEYFLDEPVPMAPGLAAQFSPRFTFDAGPLEDGYLVRCAWAVQAMGWLQDEPALAWKVHMDAAAGGHATDDAEYRLSPLAGAEAPELEQLAWPAAGSVDYRLLRSEWATHLPAADLPRQGRQLWISGYLQNSFANIRSVNLRSVVVVPFRGGL